MNFFKALAKEVHETTRNTSASQATERHSLSLPFQTPVTQATERQATGKCCYQI